MLGSVGLFAPLTLRPVYNGRMRFRLLMSKVTTPLILGIVFYLVISPMGLLRRLTNHDPMARRFNAQASSYRVLSREKSSSHLERPF